MTISECYQTLGLQPDATPENIRLAYVDLTKVWHPDRFGHDPLLQKRAEARLEAIIGAYNTLRKGGWPRPPAGCVPPESPVPIRPPWATLIIKLLQFRTMDRARTLVRMASIVAPLLFLYFIARTIPVPNFDPFHPAVAPLDLPDLPRLEDFWPSPAAPSANFDPARAPEPRSGPQPHLRKARTFEPSNLSPVNGAQMVWEDRSGSGVVSVNNETPQDALVTLMRAGRPVRAVFVQSHHSADLSMASGIYNATIATGAGWNGRGFTQQRTTRTGPGR